MSSIPQDILDWYGDFRWWTRPDVFGHPQCTRLVPNLSVAIAELRDLYPADVCEDMVVNGAGAIVVGLFLGDGFAPGVDDVLLLGADLALYDGWRDRPKLVGALRSMRGWAGAQFEVGVNAGLRRANLMPAIEPAANKASNCPDFLVVADSLTIAIELKGIRNPDNERNRDELYEALKRARWTRRMDWRGDVTLVLSEHALARLEVQHEAFRSIEIPVFEREIVAAFTGIHLNQRLKLPTLGDLLVAYPPIWGGEHYAGGYAIEPDTCDPKHLLRRAIGRARECCKQLGAVKADLRVAILWGSRGSLPAASAAQAVEETITCERTRWEHLPLDWIVFFNGHTLSRDGAWTIDLGLCRVRQDAAPIPQPVLDGLTRWGAGRNH